MSIFAPGEICLLHGLTGQYGYMNGTRVQLLRPFELVDAAWIIDVPDPYKQGYGGALVFEKPLRKIDDDPTQEAEQEYNALIERLTERAPA